MGKFALLIGVSESGEEDLPELPSAIEDIKAMQEVLQNPEIGGFDSVKVLQNPMRQEMEEAIETLFAKCKKEDLVLFYFSGHGITDEKGKLYLVTPQTRKERGNLRKATAVAATVLHDNMGNSRSKHQVLILDSCFSGAIAEGLTGKSAGSKVDIQRELGGEGRVILTSSNAVQESFHIQGYNLSIYTHYLIEGIQTGAANQDGDDYISVDELYEYAKKKLEQEVPWMSPQFFPVKEGYKIRLVRSPKLKDEKYFDVFICHNSEDKSQVRKITTQLKEFGLIPWFDEWELTPGHPWKPELYGQIDIIRSAAVFIGNSGLGPWQEREIDAFLQEFVKRKCPVIPVILETAPEIPCLPFDLTSFTCVDFRLEEPDPLQRLIWGITGKKDFISLRDSSFDNSNNVLSFAARLKSEDLQSFLYLSKWNPEEVEQEVKLLRSAYESFSNSMLKDSDILEHLKNAEVFIHKVGLTYRINNLSLRDELCARLSLADEWFLSLIDDSENRYKLRSLRIDYIRQRINTVDSN